MHCKAVINRVKQIRPNERFVFLERKLNGKMKDFSSSQFFFLNLGRKVNLMAWITVWLKICFKTLKIAVKTPLSIQIPSAHTKIILTRQAWWKIIAPHLVNPWAQLSYTEIYSGVGSDASLFRSFSSSLSTPERPTARRTLTVKSPRLEKT